MRSKASELAFLCAVETDKLSHKYFLGCKIQGSKQISGYSQVRSLKVGRMKLRYGSPGFNTTHICCCLSAWSSGNAHLALISCREEFKCGEAMDFDRFDLVGCGVHLGHNGVSAVFVFLTELLPDGSQLFAMSTPRCIWGIKQRQVLCLNEENGSPIQMSQTTSFWIKGYRKPRAIILDD